MSAPIGTVGRRPVSRLARLLARVRAPRAELESSVLSLYQGASFSQHIDFTQPPGDPGLLGPDSVGWRVMHNPATVFMGGVTAVLLEFLLPGVRAGVWEHSYFKQDPIARLKRTGLAAMVTMYGSTGQAEWLGARVTRMHQRVRGETADGTHYDAMDPALQAWVAVTAAFGFLQAYRRYLNPRLTRAEIDQYWADSQRIGRLYGEYRMPQSAAEVRSYMEAIRPHLSPSDTPREFLDIMRDTPAHSRMALPAQRLMIDGAVDLLPAWAQEMAGLTGGRARRRAQRPLVAGVVRTTDWLMRDGPPFEACRRVGVSPEVLRQ